MRFSKGRIQDELVPGLLVAADSISERLGYTPLAIVAKTA